MARGLNKVLIIGNLGRDPDMRYTPSGKPVTSFSVAVSRGWTTSGGERREATEWFNVVAWGNLAEVCNQYLRKAPACTSRDVCRPAAGTIRMANAIPAPKWWPTRWLSSTTGSAASPKDMDFDEEMGFLGHLDASEWRDCNGR